MNTNLDQRYSCASVSSFLENFLWKSTMVQEASELRAACNASPGGRNMIASQGPTGHLGKNHRQIEGRYNWYHWYLLGNRPFE